MFKSVRQKACIEMSGSKLKIRTNALEQTNINDNNNKDSMRAAKDNYEQQSLVEENQLGGNILIGNYDFLKELEITENGMAILDLNSLEQLEVLTCNNNKLKELIINGKSLKVLMARHNNLVSIKALTSPTKLSNIDISYNDFEELPNWLGACSNLSSLRADHNRLWTIDNLYAPHGFQNLITFSVAYNQLTSLNSLSATIYGKVAQLYLQCNILQKLPENFFATTQKTLKLLNVSCNNLSTIGKCTGHNETRSIWALEELYCSSNNLNESIFPKIAAAKKLRILYAAYNKIRELPEKIVQNWNALEILVLSGNKLQNLPENICALTKLQVLRLHSNLLKETPSLTRMTNLKVLDLAHNQLDHVNLLNVMPSNLKYLDLSCNRRLQFDERQVQMCQTIKKMSLVDVSGKNRACLPTTKLEKLTDTNVARQPWTVGFTETIGKCRKLQVKQIRLNSFEGEDEGLYCMLESGTLGSVTTALLNLIPQILKHERGVKETAKEYMKYTLLSVYQRLVNERLVGSEDDLHIALFHIAKESTGFRDYMRPKRMRRYVLRVASIGDIKAYLVRRTATICLTNATYKSTKMTTERHNGNSSDKNAENSHMLTDPAVHETFLSNEDEFLVICNANLWNVMDINRVTTELRKEDNIVLAAKRLQDIAQSFGADGNLSVMLIRFKYIGTDVDDLLKELKQTVRRNPITAHNFNSDDKLSIGSSHQRLIGRCSPRQASIAGGGLMRCDRSSPSGQSDRAQNYLKASINNNNNNKNNNSKATQNEEYAFATEHILEEEDDEDLEILHETESVLSEEQFKCWEYMLEQNTQLLFDKELNTISKSITKVDNCSDVAVNNLATDIAEDKIAESKESNLLKNLGNRFMSHSSPQLMYNETKKPLIPFTQHKYQEKQRLQCQQQQIPHHPHPSLHAPYALHQHQPQYRSQQQPISFLSKHFGSCRSFQTQSKYNLFESKSQNSLNIGSGLSSKWSGGPNAAYFGSLQRLMPYNLEYDFTLTQDRTAFDEEDDEFDEQDDRMKKYWGIATTEL